MTHEKTPQCESQVEALRYLSSMVHELRDVAGANRLKLVAYFLDMAYLEIGDTLRTSRAKTPDLAARTETEMSSAA